MTVEPPMHASEAIRGGRSSCAGIATAIRWSCAIANGWSRTASAVTPPARSRAFPTRKYHGLFVPNLAAPKGRHIMISRCDECVVTPARAAAPRRRGVRRMSASSASRIAT